MPPLQLSFLDSSCSSTFMFLFLLLHDFFFFFWFSYTKAHQLLLLTLACEVADQTSPQGLLLSLTMTMALKAFSNATFLGPPKSTVRSGLHTDIDVASAQIPVSGSYSTKCPTEISSPSKPCLPTARCPLVFLNWESIKQTIMRCDISFTTIIV